MTQRARQKIDCIGTAYASRCAFATSRQAGAGPVATAGRRNPSRQNLEAPQ